MLGVFASAVIVGSFCLFCENGVLGLPFDTNVASVKAAAEPAVINPEATVKIAAANATPLLIRSPSSWTLPIPTYHDACDARPSGASWVAVRRASVRELVGSPGDANPSGS
jgi:hypothetical protein